MDLIQQHHFHDFLRFEYVMHNEPFIKEKHEREEEDSEYRTLNVKNIKKSNQDHLSLSLSSQCMYECA